MRYIIIYCERQSAWWLSPSTPSDITRRCKNVSLDDRQNKVAKCMPILVQRRIRWPITVLDIRLIYQTHRSKLYSVNSENTKDQCCIHDTSKISYEPHFYLAVNLIFSIFLCLPLDQAKVNWWCPFSASSGLKPTVTFLCHHFSCFWHFLFGAKLMQFCFMV